MDIEKIFYLLAKLATSIEVLAAVFVSFYLRKTSKDLKIIILYLYVVVVQEALNWLFVSSGNNLFMYPIGALIDLVFFFWLYYGYILAKGKYRIILLLFALFGLYPLSLDFVKSLDVNNMPDLMLPGVFYSYGVILIFSIVYFLQMALLKGFKIQSKHVMISILVFLDFSVSIFYMLSINFLINETLTIVSYFWILRSLLYTLTIIVYAYLIWKHGRTPKRLH